MPSSVDQRSLSSVINEVVALQLSQGRTRVRAIREYIKDHYRAVVAWEIGGLIDQALDRRIKHRFREMTTDDGINKPPPAQQLTLPGYFPPSALAVPTGDEDEYEYVPFWKATFSDLDATIELREQNFNWARKRLVDMKGKRDFLARARKHNPDFRIREALEWTVQNP